MGQWQIRTQQRTCVRSLFQAEKLEPTHVGCYGIPDSALAICRVPHGRTDGNCFPEFIFGWTIGDEYDLSFTLALTFYPLPQERKQLWADFGFAGERSANSAV